ncbi:hypothetical protein BJ912DRAFT_1045649 [Pholiota molesta]|nr:hypothetical protein BJ912DRAFT_1045649 [Pholiota molesta]
MTTRHNYGRLAHTTCERDSVDSGCAATDEEGEGMACRRHPLQRALTIQGFVAGHLLPTLLKPVIYALFDVISVDAAPGAFSRDPHAPVPLELRQRVRILPRYTGITRTADSAWARMDPRPGA